MSLFTPKFIYFDLDDTLLDHKKAEHAGLSDIFTQFDLFNGIDIEALSATYHHINKGLWDEYGSGEIDRETLQRRRFEDTFQKLGLDGTLFKEIGDAYMNHYQKHWEWIKDAKIAYHKIALNYNVGILTNGFAETQWKKIEQFNLKNTAKEIVISEEIGVLKPNPKIFEYSTDLAGVEPSEILYVGDSLTSDVEGGSNAGWQVAWFTEQPNTEGVKRSSLVFNEFRQLLSALDLE